MMMHDGKYYLSSRLMPYNEFCRNFYHEYWKKFFDIDLGMTIVRVNELDEQYVLLFSSSRSIVNQVRFAMKQRLGGVMTRYIDLFSIEN